MIAAQRRIGAFGVCHDPTGAVLLSRAAPGRSGSRAWTLPGAVVAHGEHPEQTVVRGFAEQTGWPASVRRCRDVGADLENTGGFLTHTDAIVYDLEVPQGASTDTAAPAGEALRWVRSGTLASLPLSGLAAYTLGLPSPVPAQASSPAGVLPAPRRQRRQRFAVYGVVSDPDDRVLLTLNADGYPGAGFWHLPGGGTDFGEQPAAGLLREITEESGQAGQVGQLLGVTHRVDAGAGQWHAVRAVFRVTVGQPGPPRVLEVGGSTREAAWFTRAEIPSLPLTDVAAAYLVEDRTGGRR